MLISYHRGQGSVVLRVKVLDSSKSTGAGLTGLTFSSLGLRIAAIADNESATVSYTQAGSTIETIATLGAYAAPTATKCRFKEVDATNHPGVYEIQLADARYAVTSAKSLLVSVSGAVNLAETDAVVPLWDVDPYDAVRGGMTALPVAGTLAVKPAVTLAAADVSGNLAADLQKWLGVTPNALAAGKVDSLPVVRTGTAQGGSTSAIQLDAGASAVNSFYNGCQVTLLSGTGAGQTRVLVTYTGSTKQALVDRVWTTAPDATSVFALLASDSPAVTNTLGVSATVAKVVVRSGICQAGSTSNTIKLDAGASATDNLYAGGLVSLTGGTGAGQTRSVVSYIGSTRIITVDRAWVTVPDATTVFDIYASTNPSVFSDQGVAQAATASTITLASTASATSGVYAGSIVTILSGTDAGDTREITAYVGSTRVATISGTFAVTPDATSAYAVIPTASGTGAAPASTDVNVVSWAGSPASADANGLPKVDVEDFRGVASAGAAGYVGVDWSHVANPASALDLAGTTVKTLDQAPPDEAGVTTVLGRLTAARAGYLDNLNVGGAVASHADVLAVNQSASKHLLLATVPQFEPGETYTVEMRTFRAVDGSAVDADVTPTLTAAGQVSGDLSANLSAPAHPAAGVYRWTYTPGAGPTLEQIRFDGSATVAGSSFSLSAYSQTVSAGGSSWTSTDQSHLTAVYNKLPAGNIADQALLAAAVGSPQQAGVAVTLPAGTPAGFLTAASYGTAPGWYSAPDNADVVATLSDVVTLLGRVSGPVALGSDMQTALDRLGTLLARLTSPVPFDAGGFVESAPQYLPAIPAGWVTAAGIAAGALDGKGDWLTALSGGDTPGVVTLLTRVPGVVQPQTGDAYAAATAATALVVGVKARTDNLPADPAGMSGLAAAHGVGSWVGGGGGGGAGTGSTPVDHNYGGTDNLAYLVPGGVRVADARVDVYLTSDWSANRRGPFYVVASSLTGADGRWVRPVMLDPGTYTVVFYKPGEYGPDTASVVVS